jgi:hypothetical protein
MSTLLEGHIDPIAGSNNFSIQINDHIAKTTYILDETVESRKEGELVIKRELSKLAKKHEDKLFPSYIPMSMSCKSL